MPKLALIFLILLGFQQSIFCISFNPNSSDMTEPQYRNTSSSLRWNTKKQKNAIFNPTVGLYLKDYRGKTVQIVGETNASSTTSPNSTIMTLTLPSLKVEDHIWDGKSITLECISSNYPVFWEYSGLGSPQVRVTTERKAVNFYDTSSYSYHSVVTFSSTNHKQTGKYTCRRSDDESLISNGVSGVSVYLYVPGKMLFVLANKDELINNGTTSIAIVTVDGDGDGNNGSSLVTLPCATSVKDAVVELYALGLGGERKKLTESEYLKYDPMEGFKIDWKVMEERNYLCVGTTDRGQMNENKEEKLLLKLVERNASSFATKFGNDSKLSIGYNSTTNRIECCTSNDNQNTTSPPRMKLSSCVSISDCHFSSQLSSSSGISVGTRITTPKFSQGGDNIVGKDCESDPFMKLINSSCVAYKLPETTGDAGVLKCFLPGDTPQVNDQQQGHTSELLFSFTPNHGLVTNFALSDDVDTIKIIEMGREKLGEDSVNEKSTKAVYFCNPDPFFFATGIKWATEVTNDGGNNKGLTFLNEADGRPSLEVDETMVDLVYCFAPVVHSTTDWRNVSMRVPTN